MTACVLCMGYIQLIKKHPCSDYNRKMMKHIEAFNFIWNRERERERASFFVGGMVRTIYIVNEYCLVILFSSHTNMPHIESISVVLEFSSIPESIQIKTPIFINVTKMVFAQLINVKAIFHVCIARFAKHCDNNYLCAIPFTFTFTFNVLFAACGNKFNFIGQSEQYLTFRTSSGCK